MGTLFALFMAAVAYSSLSLGFILQKKGIEWIGWKAEKDRRFFRLFFTWLSGFLLMNLYGIPSAVALRILPPHIVSSFAGWGIVVLILFSGLILKEKLYLSDYIYSLLIICGIVMLSVFQVHEKLLITTKNIFSYLFFLFPLILITSGIMKKQNRKFKSIIFAVTSGMAAGVMIVSLKILVFFYGYYVGGYFGSFYLYIYILAAILSFISLQMALKNGSMILTGQLQYSSNIIYPLFGSYLLFNNPVSAETILSILIIVISVIKILKKH